MVGMGRIFLAAALAMGSTIGARAQDAVTLDAATLDKYVGAYQMDPKHLFIVTREGIHLFSRLGAQPQLELFPQGQTKFAPKAVPAEIEFMLDAGGAATAVTIHQNGREITMPRITQAQAAAISAQPIGHPIPVTWPQLKITPRLLTPSGGTFDVWPCFSPDGKTILFSRSSDRGQTWHLFKVAAAGGEAAPFADLPVSATRCNWSAQGMIAFSGIAGRTGGTWVMKEDGSSAHAVAATGLSDQVVYPSWYPDGKSLAAIDAESMTVKRFDVSGGTATALTDRAQVLTGMPSVSPDGKTVAFAGQKNAGQRYDQEENAVWLAENGAAHPLEAVPLQGRAPAWSPDGKRIAFESDRGNDRGHYAVFIINRDGSGLVQLTDFALDATHPVFSRDGRHMVFSHGGGISGIAVIDLP
jgi:Tol biopolymer transport system component